MASRAADRFEKELLRLFRARSHYLRSIVWASRGAEPKMTGEKVRTAIKKLQTIAEDAMLRTSHSDDILDSYDYKKQWHPKRGKGHGTSAKKRNFKSWYERNVTTQNCVYVFWAQSRCLYVGRTLNGKGRPSSHFEKRWFGHATRVDVYGFDRKRDVPRFECMFTHRHSPSYSRITPASKKYYSRCPVCDSKRAIRSEIKSLFRLR